MSVDFDIARCSRQKEQITIAVEIAVRQWIVGRCPVEIDAFKRGFQFITCILYMIICILIIFIFMYFKAIFNILFLRIDYLKTHTHKHY